MFRSTSFRRERSRAKSGDGSAWLDSAQAPAEISAVAWIPRGELDQRQWTETGRRLGVISRGSQWWIGDWLRYGTAKWGEKYAEAARITGYDTATLRNMVWVAAQFEPSLRNDRLTWSHHVLVAAMEDEEKREWLERAAADKLSVSDLRTELRALQSNGKAGSKPKRSNDEAEHGSEVVCPNCGHQLELPTAH